jgi:hypothetical protein
MKKIRARVIGLAAVLALSLGTAFQGPSPMECCSPPHGDNPGNPQMKCCSMTPGMPCCQPKPAGP